MDDARLLPDDPDECRRLLLAAYQESQSLQREVKTLNRVLDQTSDSYAQLQQEH